MTTTTMHAVGGISTAGGSYIASTPPPPSPTNRPVREGCLFIICVRTDGAWIFQLGSPPSDERLEKVPTSVEPRSCTDVDVLPCHQPGGVPSRCSAVCECEWVACGDHLSENWKLDEIMYIYNCTFIKLGQARGEGGRSARHNTNSKLIASTLALVDWASKSSTWTLLRLHTCTLLWRASGGDPFRSNIILWKL